MYDTPPQFAFDVDLLLQGEERPDPEHLAELVLNGLTREVLDDTLNYLEIDVPEMPGTEREVATITPYVRQFTDVVAEETAKKPVWFLARDAEYLYDMNAVRHPEIDSVLVPASMPLLQADMPGQTRDSFLRTHDLALPPFMNDEPAGLLVDTGFQGSAGHLLRQHIAASQQLPYEKVEKALPIGMVSRLSEDLPGEKWGYQVVDFQADDRVPHTTVDFPRIGFVGREYTADGSVPGREVLGMDPIAWRTAIALQAMPHHHGPFEQVALREGQAVALPREHEWSENVDHVEPGEDERVPNPSHVHPVAALVVQHSFVVAALEL